MSANPLAASFSHIFNDRSSNIRGKIIGIYILLIVFNIIVWALAIAGFAVRYPTLLGTALLAYSFGLRHAVDADHISAIDNVTRKLMQERKKSVTVGFFFSLGHSTIVVALTVAIALAAIFVQRYIPTLKSAGGLIGTSVSALFLYVIALINLLVLWEIFRAFRKVKNGGEYSDQTLNDFLDQRGLMGRFFRPLLKLVDKGWKMYPVGVLFGLGFDTATEVGLLAVAAAEAGRGLPIWAILIFPALFTAGMCLIDTSDGILMLGAYGWAFMKPVRKLYYNLNITLISVLVAFLVGTIEVLSIISMEFNLTSGVWYYLNNLDFGVLGGVIIGLFILSWLISTLIYKIKKYDEIVVGADLSRPEANVSRPGMGEKHEGAVLSRAR